MMNELSKLADQLRETDFARNIARHTARITERVWRTDTSGTGEKDASDRRVAFEVTEGLHSGANLDFTDTTFTIGSSLDSDVVLSDPGIAETHARFRLSANRVHIEAIGGTVALSDGQVVPEGYGRRCRLPIEATIGAARIRLTGGEPRPPVFAAIPNRTYMIAAGLLATIFAVPVASNTLSKVGLDGSAASADASLTVAGIQHPEGASQQQDRFEREARDGLKVQLEQAGIRGLEITAAEGRLMVSGTIPDHQVQAWRSVQAWFDELHQGRLLLISNVAVGDASTAPRLPLRAIWYGERPYIITSDGARYHEGAFVSGGWIIKEIGEEQLLLAKGDTVMALKYQ